MTKLYVVFLIVALALVHATARDIPNDNTKPAVVPVELTETVVTTAEAPAANGVDDKKNLIYGGVGGWAGMGYVGGVMPVLGGGLGGASGLGGLGGVGGASGLGGLGGVGGASGLGGLGGASGLGGVGLGGGAGGVGAGAGAGGAAGKIIP